MGLFRQRLRRLWSERPRRDTLEDFFRKSAGSGIGPLNLHFSAYDGLANFVDGYPTGHSAFDDRMVIFFNNVPPRKRYHYSLISRWGISALKHYYESGERKSLNSAIAQADFLRSNLRSVADQTCATLPFPFEGGGAEKDWSSAISNGAAADLFLHLGRLIDDRELIEKSEALVKTFTFPVGSGGLISVMKRGGCFFEEYAGNGVKVKHVLNGHLLGMMHLFAWLQNYTGRFCSNQQLHASVLSSFHNAAVGTWLAMDDFDVPRSKFGPTTYYDLSVRGIKPATAYPHRIHILGAEWLGHIYNNRYFEFKAGQWREMRKRAFDRKENGDPE